MRNLLLLAAGGAFCALQEGAELSVAYQDTSPLTDVPHGGRAVGYESRLKSGVTARPPQNRMRGRLTTALAAVLVVALSAAFLILQCFMLIKSKGLVASVRRLAEGGHPTCSGDGQQGAGQQGQQGGGQQGQQGGDGQQGGGQQGQQGGDGQQGGGQQGQQGGDGQQEGGQQEQQGLSQAELGEEDALELEELLKKIHAHMPPEEVEEKFPEFANGRFASFKDALQAFYKHVTGQEGPQEGPQEGAEAEGPEGAEAGAAGGEEEEEEELEDLEKLVQELQAKYIPPEEITEKFASFANGRFPTFKAALLAFYKHVTEGETAGETAETAGETAETATAGTAGETAETADETAGQDQEDQTED